MFNYNRSRVHYFQFFIQKLSHKSRVMLYKSCRVLHKETNKIGFTFSWFFCEFLRILQDLGQGQTMVRIYFQKGPWKLLNLHKTTPTSSNQVPTTPWPSQIYPRRLGRARRRWGMARAGKQVTQRCDFAHLGSIGHGFEGRGAPASGYDRAKRRRPREWRRRWTLGRGVWIDGVGSFKESHGRHLDDWWETWVPMGPYRPGSWRSLSSGPNLSEVPPTCKWARRPYPQPRRPWKISNDLIQTLQDLPGLWRKLLP
jgi:hypothetical protein